MNQPFSHPTSAPRYELHYDQMEETYSIHKVETFGPFASREDARQYMIRLSEERKRAVERV
jgi:hypothetical protein